MRKSMNSTGPQRGSFIRLQNYPPTNTNAELWVEIKFPVDQQQLERERGMAACCTQKEEGEKDKVGGIKTTSPLD